MSVDVFYTRDFWAFCGDLAMALAVWFVMAVTLSVVAALFIEWRMVRIRLQDDLQSFFREGVGDHGPQLQKRGTGPAGGQKQQFHDSVIGYDPCPACGRDGFSPLDGCPHVACSDGRGGGHGE